MGNEQSSHIQAMPENGLRLSTLCGYQAGTNDVEGAQFTWFQSSTNVSGLVLKGAHRWGYVLSHGGGQRLFKDTRQRFFVLLDHYMCYFDAHTPDARMRGSIDLDKSDCQLDLLPGPQDRAPAHEGLISSVFNSNVSYNSPFSSTPRGGLGSVTSGLIDEFDAGREEHRIEVTRKSDDWSLVLCFASATELQSWIKSIFDVQQRKATFSPLLRGGLVGFAPKEESGEGSDELPVPAEHRLLSEGSTIRRSNDDERLDTGDTNTVVARRQRLDDAGDGRWHGLTVSRSVGRHHGDVSSGTPSGVSRTPRIRTGRSKRWHDGRSRGSLNTTRSLSIEEENPSSSRGRVPSSWADSKYGEDRRPAFWVEARLGKASEMLATLPRGGRAEGGDGVNSSLDEYGAFTTAHASIYEGWTRGLQAHGWGRMICAHGDYVEGWWKHDVLEGSGEHRSREEGWTFRGDFMGGERHGAGRLVTAEGDVWECEWQQGVVASGVSGTHTTPSGELYQGGCAPSLENPRVPCRSGHGRLRRRDGEQVETHFRGGRPVDGAKGVMRFRNGAIFFGQLQDARPHGYGELYLSSVKLDARSRSLAELDAMARDVLWYKGNFQQGMAHGTGLVKYKEPPATRRIRDYSLLFCSQASRRASLSGPSVSEGGVSTRGSFGSAGIAAGGTDITGAPYAPMWGESKDEGLRGAGSGGGRLEDTSGEAVLGTDDEDGEEGEEEVEDDDEEGDADEDVDEEEGDTSDSDDEEEDDDDDDGGGEDDDREEQTGAERRQSVSGRTVNGEEEKPTANTPRSRERPPDDARADSGADGADMEYEAEFIEGVMIRHDPSHLRLAALRFGRAEIRRLETLLRQEEEAMVRLHSRSLCLLCNTEEMNALLVGCRHRVLCMGCAERTDSCPVCHERISKVVKTYST